VPLRISAPAPVILALTLLAVAELDGDGHLDLVVSNDRPDRKLAYRGDGHGNFTVTGTFGDPAWSTRNITLGSLRTSFRRTCGRCGSHRHA